MALLTRDPLTSGATLVDLLQCRATAHPDRLAFRFLEGGETETASLTYAELDRSARAIAVRLSQSMQPGERALMQFAPGLLFIEAFFGCLYAGVVPVPASLERASERRPMTRIPALAADAEPTVVLCAAGSLATLQTQLSSIPSLNSAEFIAADDAPAALAGDWVMPAIDGDTLALLQYTSGSTGRPKGVMVTHQNVLANEEMIRQGMSHDAGLIQVGWLPLYHDMGLMGNVLQPLYVGGTGVLMPPVAFLQQPFRWLHTISRYRGTTSGAPNFAFDLCVRSISDEQKGQLDLSCWQVAFNGAEPIRRETIDRFVAAFGPCGFRAEGYYPCYGMAEATLFIAGNGATRTPVTCTVNAIALSQGRVLVCPESAPAGRPLVSSGRGWLEEQIHIVDPVSRTACPAELIGEIWVSGPHVAPGYWQQEEETARVFKAHLADGGGPFLRTGDLGFRRGEDLFVTGRLKDLIIIHGANYYPQDIEDTVEASHPLLRSGCGAAFSVERDGEERLVIAQEVHRRFKPDDADACLSAVRGAVGEAHGLQADAIVLIRAGTMPKTTSGKIQRRLCRTRYLEETLTTVAEWRMPAEEERISAPPVGVQPARETIQTWLCDRIARRLGIEADALDLHEPFTAHGLDSVGATALATQLSTWLGRSLSPTLAWQYPSIAQLATHLAGEPAAGSSGAEPDPRETSTSIPANHDGAIAVVGMACRFPGAGDLAAYWRLLHDGIDAITEVPVDRWDANAMYDPELMSFEAMNTRWGGFLDDVTGFDPRFFGVSRDEATGMDPQHRLLLEVGWEALEHAGIAPASIAGSESGVFIGISTGDFYKLLTGTPTRGATGVATSLAANRLSYFFDLRGPSIAVDTACSSSLVAVHLASESLRAGSSDLAIAGGVNMMVTPDLTRSLSQAGFLSPDGRCHSFAADASGYVRSEGCGLVVLKRLADARRDGDRILAVLRGSAVNQNGRGNGITAPSVDAQSRVITRAWRQAGITPDAISYIEAHGSGTVLGDLIEVQALTAVLDSENATSAPCVLGSVKTNIGHLEAAAGVAGLIKVILALEHDAIPPHLHLDTVNPRIAELITHLTIPTKLRPWVQSAQARRAGVSSFGFGGTNAHVVVEDAPLRSESLAQTEGLRFPLALSARTAEALTEMARRLSLHLYNHPEQSLAAVAATLLFGRARFSHRLVVLADSLVDASDALAAWLAGSATSTVINGPSTPLPEGMRDDLYAAAHAWVNGTEPEWPGMELLKVVERVTLPTYPFQRVPCWPDAERIAVPVVQG